jgi:transcriptional regulator with XRE-family HTH domain
MGKAASDVRIMNISPAMPTVESLVPALAPSRPERRFHQLATIRRREGVALRTVARLLGIDLAEAARQEQETTDLPLSILYKWQAALGVPLAELLIDSEETLSPAVAQRSQLIKVMKTAATLQSKADTAPVRRLAETLVGQLLQVMPELEGVGPWQDYAGGRRNREPCGRVVERQIPPALSRKLESGDEAA